jgi:hypothetical protein
MSRFKDFVDDAIDVGSTIVSVILGGPSALKVTGAFVQGVGSTIAQPQVASAVTKIGGAIRTTGTVLNKYLAAGLKAVASASKPVIVTTAKGTATAVTTAAKSLPLSKYIMPLLKYVPYAAMTYAGAASAVKGIKTASDIQSVKAGVLDKNFFTSSANLQKYDLSKATDWWKLIRDTMAFK